MTQIENSLDSAQYVKYSVEPHKLPEPITYPGRCACGYPLKPGEVSCYFLGCWRCPSCVREPGKRKHWGGD